MFIIVTWITRLIKVSLYTHRPLEVHVTSKILYSKWEDTMNGQNRVVIYHYTVNTAKEVLKLKSL